MPHSPPSFSASCTLLSSYFFLLFTLRSPQQQGSNIPFVQRLWVITHLFARCECGYRTFCERVKVGWTRAREHYTVCGGFLLEMWVTPPPIQIENSSASTPALAFSKKQHGALTREISFALKMVNQSYSCSFTLYHCLMGGWGFSR